MSVGEIIGVSGIFGATVVKFKYSGQHSFQEITVYNLIPKKLSKDTPFSHVTKERPTSLQS